MKIMDASAKDVLQATVAVDVTCSCGERMPLERLYACTHCGEVRCPRCVQDEIVCYYCTNCLLEAPSAAVKSGRSRCVSNCAKCPVCASIASVVTSPEDETINYLVCSLCRWTSRECGLVLAKPTMVSDSLRTQEIPTTAQERFDQLQLQFAELTAQAQAQAQAQRPLTSSMSTTGRKHIRGKTSIDLASTLRAAAAANTPTAAALPPPEPVAYTAALPPPDVNQAASVTQRLRWPGRQAALQSELLPERVPLAVKRSRRCRTCNFNLIKPEPKAQTVKFSIHLCASFYLPSVKFHEMPAQPIALKQRQRVLIKVRNPQDVATTLTLSSSDARIELPKQELSVAGFNETGDYEEDDQAAAEKGPTDANVAGLVQRRQNYVVFSMFFTVTEASANVPLPLHVDIKYAAPTTSASSKRVPAFDVTLHLLNMKFAT